MDKSALGEIIRDSYTPNGVYQKDTRVWLDLLGKAYKKNVELFYKLFYLRGVGTIIVVMPNGTKKLEPIIGTQGWFDMAEWEREKRCLLPHIKELVEILSEL